MPPTSIPEPLPSRQPVSVLIHTFNEIEQIEGCIESVTWADEIFLIDAFSTDGTVELVRSRFPQVHVEQRKSLGSASQKNWGMERVRHDWVLVVDADERITPALHEEIQRLLASPRPPCWGYSIGRRNFVLGAEVQYSGLQRDRVTRLFHRGHARYPNRRVHAELVVDGPVGMLRQKMVHNYVRSLDHMAEKMTRYGWWGAAQLFLEGKRTNLFLIFAHSALRFLRDYVINFGFLDGTRGLIIVGMHVYYTFWKYSKLWEFTRLERHGESIPLPALDMAEERWLRPWEKADQAKADSGR